MTMVAVQVFGNDAAIGFAGSQGNFELNVFNPVMIHNLLHSIRLIKDACHGFVDYCVAGIELNREKIDEHLQKFTDARDGAQPAHRLRQRREDS